MGNAELFNKWRMLTGDLNRTLGRAITYKPSSYKRQTTPTDERRREFEEGLFIKLQQHMSENANQ